MNDSADVCRDKPDPAQKKRKAPSCAREPSIYRVTGLQPVARRLLSETEASERLNRYAIFSFWLSSSSLSSLLSSSPLVVTSFWLTKILSVSFGATTHVHTKELHEQITEKNKKSSYIFLSSKTLRILDKIFRAHHFTESRISSTITLRQWKSQ